MKCEGTSLELLSGRFVKALGASLHGCFHLFLSRNKGVRISSGSGVDLLVAHRVDSRPVKARDFLGNFGLRPLPLGRHGVTPSLRANRPLSRPGEGETRPLGQFRLLSTSAFCLIHGIIPRRRSPTCSIGCAAMRARVALKEVWLTRFSSIQSRVNLRDWMSSRTRLISAFVSAVMMRGPVTYSPYSAVFEIE